MIKSNSEGKMQLRSYLLQTERGGVGKKGRRLINGEGVGFFHTLEVVEHFYQTSLFNLLLTNVYVLNMLDLSISSVVFISDVTILLFKSMNELK